MVWQRLKAWLFGGPETEGGEEGGPDTEDAADSESRSSQSGPAASPAYRCAVCGTAVDGADADCPLCGASDVETGDTNGGTSPEPTSERVSDDSDDAAERLRELRADALRRHEEKWEREGEGYRVRTPDGEWRRASTEEDVRAVLRQY